MRARRARAYNEAIFEIHPMSEIELKTLLDSADELLQPQRFRDYCPNGLQVEGKAKVKKLVAGVTASLAFIEAGVKAGADALFVHHGCLWDKDPSPVVGMRRRRIKALLDADVSLLAYHLPLDALPEYGNNAQLAKLLSMEISGPLEPNNRENIGYAGALPKSMPAGEFAAHVEKILRHKVVHIGDPAEKISTIAWCSGGAQSYFKHAAALGVQAFLTGEISEQNPHEALEQNMHYFAAGHHATERGGPQAAGEHLAEKHGLDFEFIDIDNPA